MAWKNVQSHLNLEWGSVGAHTHASASCMWACTTHTHTKCIGFILINSQWLINCLINWLNLVHNYIRYLIAIIRIIELTRKKCVWLTIDRTWMIRISYWMDNVEWTVMRRRTGNGEKNEWKERERGANRRQYKTQAIWILSVPLI